MSDPYQLWLLSGGDREKYRRLLIEHGLLVPRCQKVGEATGRRCCLEADHVGNHDFEPKDIFGHRVKEGVR